MRIVTDKPEKVAQWAGRRLGEKFSEPFIALGIEDRHGQPRGAVVFNVYTGPGGNIDFSAVGRHCFTRRIFRFLADYAFNELGVRRVTARTRPDNERAITALIKGGWRVEGRMREYFSDGSDALIFGMTRRECNFLEDNT